MKVKACIRSGECCKAAPCAYGRWNEDGTQCEFLVGAVAGEYNCGIYSDIVRDPSSVVSPAFGSGCCRSLFNQSRDRLVKVKYSGEIPYVEI